MRYRGIGLELLRSKRLIGAFKKRPRNAAHAVLGVNDVQQVPVDGAAIGTVDRRAEAAPRDGRSATLAAQI